MLLDGYPLVGEAAYDLAFAAARLGSPEAAAQHLLEGYGETPPRFEQWLRWRCLFDYAAALEDPKRQFIPGRDISGQLRVGLG